MWKWIVERIPSQRVKRCIEIVRHLDSVSNDILRRKKAALAKGDEAMLAKMGEGKDIMSVLRTLCPYTFVIEPLTLIVVFLQYSEGEYRSDR